MMTGFWGKKIGMTQLFVDGLMVPVTAIDATNWFVVGIRTLARDGHDAIQIGRLRARHCGKPFLHDWLKHVKRHFELVREVNVEGDVAGFSLEQAVNVFGFFEPGHTVNVSGTTKGCGFAGVVRRHRFNGPPGSHGSNMGKRPGAMSFMRRQGRIIKGKRLPGHMGDKWRMARNLEIMHVEPEAGLLLVKGCVPGKSGSFVRVLKA